MLGRSVSKSEAFTSLTVEQIAKLFAKGWQLVVKVKDRYYILLCEISAKSSFGTRFSQRLNWGQASAFGWRVSFSLWLKRRFEAWDSAFGWRRSRGLMRELFITAKGCNRKMLSIKYQQVIFYWKHEHFSGMLCFPIENEYNMNIGYWKVLRTLSFSEGK